MFIFSGAIVTSKKKRKENEKSEDQTIHDFSRFLPSRFQNKFNWAEVFKR